jgi:hypothetical protein
MISITNSKVSTIPNLLALIYMLTQKGFSE